MYRYSLSMYGDWCYWPFLVSSRNAWFSPSTFHFEKNVQQVKKWRKNEETMKESKIEISIKEAKFLVLIFCMSRGSLAAIGPWARDSSTSMFCLYFQSHLIHMVAESSVLIKSKFSLRLWRNGVYFRLILFSCGSLTVICCFGYVFSVKSRSRTFS